VVKKRLVGVITVVGDLAIQSVSYKDYFPLGDPVVLIENLDRWGADEILVQCIDRTSTQSGPNFQLLEHINRARITTPLIYAGGIASVADAVRVVNLGADRIVIDNLLWNETSVVEFIAKELGVQAIIGNLPVEVIEDQFMWTNYITNDKMELSQYSLDRLPLDYISEVMITDFVNEGHFASFDERLLGLLPILNKPGILFGGISDPQQINRILESISVVAVGVGNFLSYKEHAFQSMCKSPLLRHPTFTKEHNSICQ
jgi:cyclase